MAERFLRRYTTLPSLLYTLTLLDPQSWDDKNDSYYRQLYKEKKRLKSVLPERALRNARWLRDFCVFGHALLCSVVPNATGAARIWFIKSMVHKSASNYEPRGREFVRANSWSIRFDCA